MTNSSDPHADDLWEDVLDPVDDAHTTATYDAAASPGTAADGTAPAGTGASATAGGDGSRDAPTSRRGRKPRARANRKAVLGLGAVILLGAGFAGGVVVQQQRGGATATGGAAGGMAGMPSGMPSGGFPAMGGGPAGGFGGTAGGSGGAAGGSATVGTVANVRGGTIYVTTGDGTTVRVVASSGATVSRTSRSSMTGVHPGDSVVVSGETDDDGTVKATSVRATSSNATGR